MRRPLHSTNKGYIVALCAIALQLAGCGDATNRAQSYYQHGKELLEQHDDQKAAVEFKNALKLKGDLLPAWRGLAQAEEASGHLDRLIPVLQTIIQLDPQDLPTRLKLARLLLLAGAADQASTLVDGVGATGDNNSDVHGLKALILYKLNNRDRAVREAQAALETNPGNIDAVEVLASDRLNRGDASGTLTLLDATPFKQNTSLGIQLLRIKISEKLGNLKQVEASLLALVDAYPGQLAFRDQLIKLYMGEHRYDEAENRLRAAATAEPKNSKAGLDLIRFLYAVKGPEVARQELVSRIATGGDVFQYQLTLAELDFAQGNLVDGSKLLESIADDAAPGHALIAKLKLAAMNVEKKRLDVAEPLVADVLRDKSLDGLKARVSALKLRASIAMERGHPEAAIPDLREVLGRESKSPDLMLLLATAYERNGSIDLAERQYSAALSVSNFDANIGLTYVAFLERRGNTDRAGEVLAELASRQPKNLAVLSAQAEVTLSRGDWKGAKKISDEMRSVDNGGAVADRILGAALAGERKYGASIAVLQNAVAAAPNDVRSMIALVRAFMLSKQKDRAVSFLQASLKSNPKNVVAHVLLGSIAEATDSPEQAVNDFEAAIQKQPKSSIGYRSLADFYLRQNNAQAAVLTLRAGLQQQPQDVSLHLTLGGALERIGDYEGAISEYEGVLAQEPGSLVAANNLASLLADHRADKSSLERASSLAASLQQSQVPQFKDTLGWVNYRRGDYKAAIQLLEQAAVALPDLAMIHYHLGMSYAAMGQNAKAVQEYKIALSRHGTNDLKETIKAELTRTATE